MCVKLSYPIMLSIAFVFFCRLLIELLTMRDDTIALEKTKRELVALDPSNLEVLPLAKLLITKGTD